MSQNVLLADALLRRKQLQEKVDQIRLIKDRDLFETKATRRLVAEGIDDIVAQVPKLTLSEVTKEYDYYSKQLRLVDSVIQRTNWITEIEVADTVMQDFAE